MEVFQALGVDKLLFPEQIKKEKENVIEDIYEYFKEDAESDSLEAAMEELGSDYDEMEVRLVRVKFLCEVAN